MDNAMYIQLPEEYRSQATSGKPWGKLSADSELATTIGAVQAQQNNPGCGRPGSNSSPRR